MGILSSTSPPQTQALFKNMLKGSSLYLIAAVAPNVVSILLIRVVTSRLTTADYGVLDMIQQVAVILSVVLGLNFAEALGYFYFEEGAEKQRVVGTVLCGSLMLGSLVAVVGWLLTGAISRLIFHTLDYTFYLRLIFALMPLSFLLEAGFGWLRVENRTALFTGLTLTRIVIGLSLTIVLLVGFHMRVGGVVLANAAAGAVVSLIIGGVALRKYGVRFSVALFRRMLRFSSYISLTAIALFTIHFGDRFVLSKYWSFGELGVYALAYKIGMMISLVQSSFGTYWAAQVFQLIKRQDAAWVFGRSFTYYMSALCFCGLAVLVAAKPALLVLTTPAYFRAGVLIPIILLAYLIRSSGDFFRFLFLAQGLPHYDTICGWIIAAISISSYFLLIPRYGAMGAALATLITFVAAAVLSLVWVYRVWPYRLELVRLGKLGLVTAGITALHFALPSASFLGETLEGLALLAGFAGLLLLWRFPTEGETQTIRSTVSRLIPFRPASSAGDG